MRPQNLHTKIFLDSGDPQDTREVLTSIGFLDGQTTNPSLIIKNPEAQERLARGAKFTQDEVTAFYKNVIAEIVEVLGDQSISIEVSADQCTTAESIIKQAHEMTTWAKHPHIKIPITREGLKAGEILSREGIHLNYTLNFSQQQAAAVHAATRGAKKEQIYISPFHGRLDDYGVRGADVIANIEKMYRINHSHVQVLVASVRDYDTFLFAIASKTDIVTVPRKVLMQWKQHALPVPTEQKEIHTDRELAPQPYQEIDLQQPWERYNIQHDLTDAGIKTFVADWNKIIIDGDDNK